MLWVWILVFVDRFYARTWWSIRYQLKSCPGILALVAQHPVKWSGNVSFGAEWITSRNQQWFCLRTGIFVTWARNQWSEYVDSNFVTMRPVVQLLERVKCKMPLTNVTFDKKKFAVLEDIEKFKGTTQKTTCRRINASLFEKKRKSHEYIPAFNCLTSTNVSRKYLEN